MTCLTAVLRYVDTAVAASLDHPRAILGLATALLLLAVMQLVDPLSGAPRIEVDPSMDALLPQSGPAFETYRRSQQLFRDDDLLLVAWQGPDLFTPTRLAAVRRFTRWLEHQPDVTRVDSMANALNVEVGEDATRSVPFLQTLPVDRAAATQLRDRLMRSPLYAGRLVSHDGDGLLFAVHFRPALDTATLRQHVDAIRAASARAAETLDQFVTGPLAIRLAISRALQHDLLYLTPLAALMTLAVTALGFRSLIGVALPLIANGGVTLGILAIFVTAGHRPDFVTVMLAPVVFVIGFAYSVHVICEFDRQHRLADEKRAAVRASCRALAVPLGLTALTTVLAFLALSLNDIASLRLFGRYTAAGVALAWFTSMFVIPAALTLVPCSTREARSRFAVPPRQLAPRIAAQRTRILALGALVAIAALVMTRSIEVDTAVLENFSGGSEVRANFEQVSEQFAGPVPIRVLITAARPDTFRQPEALRALDQFASWLRQQPGIGGATSLADYVAELHRAVMPEQASQSRLPESARATAHVILGAGGPELQRFVDPQFRTSLVHIDATTLSTAAVNRLAATIEQGLARLPPALNGEVTGTTYLTASVVQNLTRGQLQSLALAFVAVLLVLAVVYRSTRLALLALIPNLLPVLGYFALLGILPITLNLTTSLVACAVFGIAIDDTVHFLARLGAEVRAGADPVTAVSRTLAVVWRPVTLTTLALAAGFLALGAAELRSQADFGVLAAITLLAAWLVDVTFTPALALATRLAGTPPPPAA